MKSIKYHITGTRPLVHHNQRLADPLDPHTKRVAEQQRIVRTRPRFNDWALTFEVLYDETRINPGDITQALADAGAYVGLCDYRPRYGRFDVEVVK